MHITAIDFAIEKRIPPNLRVEVQVIAPENVKLTLIRRETALIPRDRLQPYDLIPRPANGGEGRVRITIDDVWHNYKADSPWIRGIKIFLPDGSSVQKSLRDDD